jgi:hypothetical protein
MIKRHEINKKIIINIIAHTGFPYKIPPFEFANIYLKCVSIFFFFCGVGENYNEIFNLLCSEYGEDGRVV